MQKSKPIKVGDLVRLKPCIIGDLDPRGVTAMGWVAVVLELTAPPKRFPHSTYPVMDVPCLAVIQWPNNFIQHIQLSRLENISGRVSIT